MALTPPSATSARREAALVTAPRCAMLPRVPSGASSLVAVTRRLAVRFRIAAASAELGLPPPVFCERVDDVSTDGSDIGVVILDLGCCCTDTGLPRLVRQWMCRRPGSDLVLLAPLLDRDSELDTVLALLRAAGDARLRIITASEFYRDGISRTLAALRVRAVLERELRAEFLAAVARTGRSMRAAGDVLDLLTMAPRHAAIDAHVEALLMTARVSAARMLDARVARERRRKARWKQLRRAGQMPPSCLLLVFRVLWFTKLRQSGWPTARVAELLDFASPREFARAIRRRMGIGVRALQQVRYADALEWAAQLVVAEHAPPGSTAVRALTGALLHPVSWDGRTSGSSPEPAERTRR